MAYPRDVTLNQALSHHFHHSLMILHSELLSLENVVQHAVGKEAGSPGGISALSGEVQEVDRHIGRHGGHTSVKLSGRQCCILALALSNYRLRIAVDLEAKRRRAIALDLLGGLQSSLKEVDDILSEDWYLEAEPLQLPLERDFLAVERAWIDPENAPPRDDKFGILLSASNIAHDMIELRRECERRAVPLAVAFADVDGLKALNDRLGETGVDELVLPRVMRAVEQVAFGHGKAYRHGGDEFVILCPSADEQLATAVLQRLMRALAETPFPLDVKPPTMSIGVCVLNPSSVLTVNEALHWAARAKQDAKAAGRNRIGTVTAGRLLQRPETRIVLPA